MISLETSLSHMAWADNKLFTEIQRLPNESLLLFGHDSEWTVGRNLMHILQGVQWYRFLLMGSQSSDLKVPTAAAEVELLRVQLSDMYESLIVAATQPDAMVEFEDEGGKRCAPRSVVLSQAPYHAAEHRANIVGILHAHGERSIHLDDYDVWAWYYETQTETK